MTAVTAPRRHPAAVAEDVVVRIVVAAQRRLGWRPAVIGYTGYGATAGVAGAHGDQGWVRVLARVVMSRPGDGGTAAADIAAPGPVRGWRNFVTSHVAAAAVTVTVGGVDHAVTADRSGVVDAVLPVAMTVGMHPVVLCPAGGRAAEGRVMVWGDVTRGLVSDIDDTVMVTWLPRPFLAAWNTFVLRETARREVGGMAVLYREFVAAHPGAAMVYLSTGAWNAAPVLRRFLHRHGFPDGPLLLTDWGPSNTGWFRSGRDHKREQLDRLARELPGVRWLLVGDDGQHDPELYEAFAGRFPDSVDAIALRQLTIAEQVLSRGAPVPPAGPDDGGVPSAVSRVNGHDGHALLEQLRRRGVL